MKKLYLSLMFVFSLLLYGCMPNQYEESMNKGKNALEENKYEIAIGYFEKAVKEEGTAEAELLLSESKVKMSIQNLIDNGNKAINEKNIDNAITIFSDLIIEHKNNPKMKELVDVAKISLKEASSLKEMQLIEIANSASKDKSYGVAMKYYSQVLEMNPDHAEVKKLLKYSENMHFGSEALRIENYDEAISLFTIALFSKPNDEVAEKLKEEALKGKNEFQQILAAYNMPAEEVSQTQEVASTDDNIETEESVEIFIEEEEDYLKNEFVFTMNQLMNVYNQEILTPISMYESRLTNVRDINRSLETIYADSINVYLPYPEYQLIIDEWLNCLVITSELLFMFEDLGNGNSSTFNPNTVTEVYEYYERVEKHLLEI